ncbi:MAG: hypothetical protein ACRC8S_05995 [Fimbriiglobus sp.]
MAGNKSQKISIRGPQPDRRRVASPFWKKPFLRLETLEAREVPAIITTGLPTWLDSGPYPTANGQVTGLTGSQPDAVSGAVVDVAPHPTDANIMFVAGVAGGIWRTTNAQDADPTFTPLTDFLPSLSIAAMDMNPANPNQVIAGIGDKSAASGGFGGTSGDLIGLVYSENALDPAPTFRVIMGPNREFENLEITSVAVRNDYILVTGKDNDGTTTREGVFLSRDGGLTFRKLDNTGGLPDQVLPGRGYLESYVDPSNPNRVYIGGPLGMWRTDNILAQTPLWLKIDIPTMAVGNATDNLKFAVHSSPGNNIVYTVVANAGVPGPVFWSPDFGQTWNQMDLAVALSSPQFIEDIPNGSPITIDSTEHGLATGDRIFVSGVTGNLEANGVWTVTRTGADTFTLDGSVQTGVYTGGGIFQKITGVSPGGQTSIHFALVADPASPNLVYLAGDRQDLSGFGPNGTGASNFTGNIMRGNRSIPRGFDALATSPQWSPITDNNALGTAPHADHRILAFDAAGNLIDGDDGGLYRRPAPQSDSSAWVSINGNLGLGQLNSISYDIQNNVVFGGTQDTGSIEQQISKGIPGNSNWDTVTQGDGGQSAVDNFSTPGISARYTMGNNMAVVVRREFNSKGVQVGLTRRIRFAAIDDPTPFKGINNEAGSSFDTKFVLNTIDPRMMLIGLNDNVYEDNNPAGFAGDVVAKVTPTGLTGFLTAVTYGGRQSGIGFPRISYVGTDEGELFVRGSADGWVELTANIQKSFTVAGGAIRSIVSDPDNWRTTYVLYGSEDQTDYSRPHVPTQILVTDDAGATWRDITENLWSKSYDNNGNLVGGLSSNIRSLTIWDPTPGDITGGNTVLIAGGVGGVFRYVPGIVDPNAASGGWTEYGTGMPNAIVDDVEIYGNRLVAATMGRGAWSIEDVSTTIKVAAQVTVQGDASDNNFTFGGSGSTPGTVRVSDGQGNTLIVEKNTGASFRFVGSTGADTLTLLGSGQAGGDLSFVTSEIIADMGNNAGDTIIINNAGRTTAVTATITSSSVGGGAGDNIFGAGFRSQLTYTGLAQGNLILDLGTRAVNGNIVNVHSTASAATKVFGTNGGDTFILNSLANKGITGDLNSLFGTISVDGRQGGFNSPNTLVVSDLSTTTGNNNANITETQILGLAGPSDAAVIEYTNISKMNVTLSDSSSLAESIRVSNPAAALVLNTLLGPDTVNVRAINNTADINTGGGDDLIRVTSLAGDSNEGDLSAIRGSLNIEAGKGDNRLMISDFANPFGNTYVIAEKVITGGTSLPINYLATEGRFFDTATGNGVWVRGSNASDDTFSITSTLEGSQTALDGNGGNDGFNIEAQNLGKSAEVFLRGGVGSDSFVITSGVFGITSNFLRVSGGGFGVDRTTVLGFTFDDKITPVYTINDTTNGSLTGVGNPLNFDTLTNFDYDGRGGRNNFIYREATNGKYGSFAAPEAGIIYQPKSKTGGEIRLTGVGPVVNVTNISGSDTGGLVINGDANGTGAIDTLTILGTSDTTLVRTGPLAETGSPNGSDEITVTDQFVTIRSEGIGQLRSVAPGLTNGKQTLSLLLVKGGLESTRGDVFSVTPSRDLNIFVDGEGPLRKRNGDRLDINTAEARSIQRVDDPTFGPPQTRIITDSGKSAGFRGFENASGARSIFAVGADIGGGPRVRVYDAITKEVLFDRFVYAPEFTGGVRVATGDVTGDGVPDLVVSAGFGGGPHIQVFDGIDFAPVSSFFAYESTFRGGSFISIADLTGDGVGDIITGAGNGGGPLVKVFDAQGRALTAFLAYDKNFRGGVRVGAGDVNGDGLDDIVTGAGVGGGPLVRVFNASNLNIITQFFAYEDSMRTGIFVTAGDLDGDGTAEVVVGPGGNEVPELRVRNGRDGSVSSISVFDIGVISSPDPLPTNAPEVLSAVGSPDAEIGGIRVAITDLDDTGRKQIVTSRGPGYPSRVRGFTIDPLAETGNDLAFEPEFTGGIYVG